MGHKLDTGQGRTLLGGARSRGRGAEKPQCTSQGPGRAGGWLRSESEEKQETESGSEAGADRDPGWTTGGQGEGVLSYSAFC